MYVLKIFFDLIELLELLTKLCCSQIEEGSREDGCSKRSIGKKLEFSVGEVECLSLVYVKGSNISLFVRKCQCFWGLICSSFI